MTKRLVRQCIVAALVFGAVSPPAFGQQAECFQLAQSGVKPEAWRTIRSYFRSLAIGDRTTEVRRRLIMLRKQIIDLEIHKQQLINLLEDHLAGSASAVIVSDEVRLSGIPDILVEIDLILQRLGDIAEADSLCAAEKAF